MATCRTITLPSGALGCACGEDHGPSLREECTMWERLYRETSADLGAELAEERTARATIGRQLGLALRRISRLKQENKDLGRDLKATEIRERAALARIAELEAQLLGAKAS